MDGCDSHGRSRCRETEMNGTFGTAENEIRLAVLF